MKAIVEIASVVLSCPHCKERITEAIGGRELPRVWLWENFEEHPMPVECSKCGKEFEIPGQFEAFSQKG